MVYDSRRTKLSQIDSTHTLEFWLGGERCSSSLSAITGQGGGAGFTRAAIAKAVGGTMIASEILSYALNGKSTFQNEPGHQLEVRVGTDRSGKGIYMGFMPGNVQAYGNLT